jgi:dolichol-phosphate mannosyltransferase
MTTHRDTTEPAVEAPHLSTRAADPASLSLAVVIPAHDEASHIAYVLASIPDWVTSVIVVDDASDDATADVALAHGDPRVTVVRRDTNGGVGAATKTGYRAAIASGCDLVAKMDADGQMLGDELDRLVEPFRLGIADYAKGNRFYFRDATLGMPAERSFGNSALSFMTKLASGYWHVFDSQCGYTVASAPYLALLDLDQLADDYFFENDMLIRMNALNARVVDVPISTVYGAEVSGVSIVRVVLSFPPRLLANGVRRFWRKNLVTDFGPIAFLTSAGMLLGAFGAAFGGYHWWLSDATGTPATTGTVMIAVLPLVVGLQLLIQAFSMSVAASPGAAETAGFIRRLIRARTFE